ncbi:hypothetical protein VT930_11895 [Mycobacterium sherrisii]|uniref:hypothetical protein n=1 Tax=Mycobacterium sherrisii TaxID=243061 RepID=UPI002DDD7DBF|nr:hypothetical protein [Mycobacterium sherrisii]MEC4763806.1 hypothetical protein [Mycobacterium sherrisii]
MGRLSAEALHEQTGLTAAQLNKRIVALHKKGLSLRQIAQAVGLSHVSVKYRLDELLHNKKRPSVTREICEGCWEDFPSPQLDGQGLCNACRTA